MEETKTSPYARRYPEELRERAVRMVQETIAQGHCSHQWRSLPVQIEELEQGTQPRDPALCRSC